LSLGNPWHISTDVGPVIDAEAQRDILSYIDTARAEGRVLYELQTPNMGHFVAPTLIKVDGIQNLGREIFGPVLHIATFKSDQLDQVIDDINATGFGLTFGLQTRIDDRVQYVSERIHAGNIYVNRNQIGAIVGSQPFGGEGLSGTGPKAGGPLYLDRFRNHPAPVLDGQWPNPFSLQQFNADLTQANTSAILQRSTLPGPTGESNQLSQRPRKPILCAGPGADAAQAQAEAVTKLGGHAIIANGTLSPDDLTQAPDFGGVIWWGDAEQARALAIGLSQRSGEIIPLITGYPDTGHAVIERHVCIDTTAAGGNAALLAGNA